MKRCFAAIGVAVACALGPGAVAAGAGNAPTWVVHPTPNPASAHGHTPAARWRRSRARRHRRTRLSGTRTTARCSPSCGTALPGRSSPRRTRAVATGRTRSSRACRARRRQNAWRSARTWTARASCRRWSSVGTEPPGVSNGATWGYRTRPTHAATGTARSSECRARLRSTARLLAATARSCPKSG
jgi:hypothetical protein